MWESLAEDGRRVDTALWALARGKGLGSPAAYPYLRRLWTWYPTHKAGHGPRRPAQVPDHRPEVALRAEQLMNSWRFEAATRLYDAQASLHHAIEHRASLVHLRPQPFRETTCEGRRRAGTCGHEVR